MSARLHGSVLLGPLPGRPLRPPLHGLLLVPERRGVLPRERGVSVSGRLDWPGLQPALPPGEVGAGLQPRLLLPQPGHLQPGGWSLQVPTWLYRYH